MATLNELVQAGLIRPLKVHLRRTEYEDRKIFASDQFLEWLNGPVKLASPFYEDDVAPKMQAAALLKSFITGAPFLGSRLFKKMSPATNDVWEMRSPDLRFFGWFPCQDCYVAVSGDLFGNLKDDVSLYEKHRIECVQFRSELNMTEPKYMVGAKENDVVSE